MADNKYYWLKLKKDFFKRHDIRIVESMENGKDYILFYLKLLCESVDHEGNLRFSEEIPYNAEMLATITNTNIDIVRSAVDIFQRLHMMDVFDDGTMFMNECLKMIGCETTWAEKKRQWRDQQKTTQGQLEDNVLEQKDNVRQEIEIEKEIELELDINNKNIVIADDCDDVKIDDCNVKLTPSVLANEFDEVWKEYPRKQGKQNALKAYSKARKDGATKEEIMNGIFAYKLYISERGIEDQYIKQGSTWFNQRCWMDDYTVSAGVKGTAITRALERQNQIIEDMEGWSHNE